MEINYFRFKVIGAFSDRLALGLKSLNLGTSVSSATLSSYIRGFLYFLHCIDDPAIIIGSILPALTSGSELATKNSNNPQKFVYEDMMGLENSDSVNFDSMSDQQIYDAFSSFVSFICKYTTKVLQTEDGSIIDFSLQCDLPNEWD